MNIIIKSLTFTLFVSQCVLSNAWSTDRHALPSDDIVTSPKRKTTLKNTATDIDAISKELICCAEELPTEVIDIITEILSLLDAPYHYYNGILQYTPEDGGQKVLLRFSDFKDRTFNLSACGNAATYHVITQSMKRFFIVGGDNRGKLVTLPVLREVVEQAVKEDPNHAFANVLKSWPKDKPVGFFCRYGSYKNLAWFDYQTTSTLAEISQCNLSENWKKGYRRTAGRLNDMLRRGGGTVMSSFMFIFEPK